jgi:protein-tyrosine-phosphatase
MDRRPHRLLFVCTGNLCRSPMAEGLARAASQRFGTPVEARSGGTLGLLAQPADPEAVAVCAELGVDVSTHESAGVDVDAMNWADWVLVMEMRHADILRDKFPRQAEKVLLLGTFGGRPEIADPLGAPRARFRACRDEIGRAVDTLVARLPKDGARA